MAGQGTRSEASIDIDYDEYSEVLISNTTEQRLASCHGDKSNFGDSGKNSAQTEESPTDRRKRKRLAPPSTPKLAEGFGNSEAGELLKNVPQLEGVFKIIKKVGEGTFSNVYLAQMIDNPRELVALKHIIPTSSPLRIENELRCLLDIGGRENVIGIKTTLRHNDHVVFVLPYVPHQKFQEYILDMSVCEIREYMRNLFIALKRVHSFNIIHRDVKPSNFLFSSELKSYTLVDFGLAMPIPGATDSILGPSKQSNKNSTQNPPKFTSPINYKIPKKRSARHSPHLDAGSERSPKERKKEESASSKQVLKQSSVDNINSSIQFTRSTKSFQLPSRNSSIRIKRSNSTAARNSCKPAQVLCPLRHGPNEICAACMARGNQNAPRAGTPGFRSLEVLCKYPDQTTAVDIWSAGIMFLCVLSGRYPFFKAYDDLTALAQLITIFGSKETAKAAFGLGKDLVVSSEIPSMNLSTMCQKLRQNVNNGQTCSYSERRRLSSDGNHKFTRKTKRRDGSSNTSSPKTKTAKDNGKRQFVHSCCTMCKERSPVCDGSCKQHLEEKQSSFTADFSSEEESFKETDRRQHSDGSKCSCTCIDCCWMVPHSAYDLLEQCLKLDPRLRISADEALRHPFFSEVPSRSPCVER